MPLLTVDYIACSADDLVAACVQKGEGAAWEEFVRRFQPVIAATALRTARRWSDPSPQLIDDLVQETFLKLCADEARLLRAFRPSHEGAIFGYIKVLTANLVHDHYKARASRKRGGDVKIASSSTDHYAQRIASNDDLDRKVLVSEVDACLRSLGLDSNGLRDRRIFWLYYRAGLSAGAIADIPAIGVGIKGVESILLRLTRLVRGKLTEQAVEKKGKVFSQEGVEPQDSF